MGIYSRIAAAFLVAVALPALSATRYEVGTIQATANGKMPTGVAYSKSSDFSTLISKDVKSVNVISGQTTTKLNVTRSVGTKVAGIGSKVKNIVKFNPGRIALSAAISGAVAGVGWVMSDDNTKVRKKVSDGTPIPLAQYGWVASNFCHNQKFVSIQALADCAVAQRQAALSGYTVKLDHIETISPNYKRIWLGQTYDANGSYTAYNWAGATQEGTCESPAYVAGDQCLTGGPTFADVSDADLPALDTFIAALQPAALGTLFQEACEGSKTCVDSMLENPQTTGTSPFFGPKTTTTTLFLKPDGTQGTRQTDTQTKFDATYGPDYVDVKPTDTKTTTVDGVKTEEETTSSDDTSTVPDKPEEEPEPEYTFQDSELPGVEPFYTQKYPDGLEGVWNQKRQEFEDSEFMSFLGGFVPSFSGSCPSFGLQFNIASWANFGSFDFFSLCYVFEFIKIILMVTTVFTCRALIFGG